MLAHLSPCRSCLTGMQKRTGRCYVAPWRTPFVPVANEVLLSKRGFAALAGYLPRSTVKMHLAGWPAFDMRCRSSRSLYDMQSLIRRCDLIWYFRPYLVHTVLYMLIKWTQVSYPRRSRPATFALIVYSSQRLSTMTFGAETGRSSAKFTTRHTVDDSPA